MSKSFTLREMTAADSPALALLTEQSPDGGEVTFNPRFHVPVYEAFTSANPDMAGVVAEMEGVEGLVGAGRVTFGECQYEGKVYPYALLSALMVHPKYRRQGIASALAQWRIDRALERNGEESIILADIQFGNVGSTANARKWASQIGGHVATAPISLRTQPPPGGSGITIREARADELETIAQNLNTFYRDHNFYRPQTAASLREWLGRSPFDTPVNYYWVAVDSANRLLAGMGLREDGRLMSLSVKKMPIHIRLANFFLKVVPPNGEMVNLQVDKLWFAPGQLEAARHLWQTARWEWRDRGTGLLINYDPRSPIPKVIQNQSWMPTTSLSIALRAPTPISVARHVCPLV